MKLLKNVAATLLLFPAGAIILATVFISAGNAATLRPTSLSVANVPGYPGTVANVPVSVRHATNIVAAQFDLAFNPERTRPRTASLANLRPGHLIRSREIAPGVYRAVVYSPHNVLLRTNGFTAVIPFQMPEGERIGSGPITPENVVLADRDGSRIAPVTAVRGAIFSQFVNAQVDGAVQFFLPSESDKQYQIQASTNLIDWATITNVFATGDFLDLVDQDAPNHPKRFYRSVRIQTSEMIGPPAIGPSGELIFSVEGTFNGNVVVEDSTNLIDWIESNVLTPSGGLLVVTNSIHKDLRSKFFRLRFP